MAQNINKSCFTVDQICQLRELEKLRIKAGGEGFGSEIQELITRIESGGVKEKFTDPRVVQAKKLFKKGWGRALGFKKFAQYLETIPEVPASLLADNPKLPLLVLVDPRLGITKSCRLAGLKYVEYGYTENSMVPFDKRHALPKDKPYWIRAHDGSLNLGRKPSDCRAECVGALLAGTADVAVAIWVQYRPTKYAMDLPGSVHAGDREICACADSFDDPGLSVGRNDDACAISGTVVFILE